MKKMNQVFDDMPLHIDGITCMMDIYQQSNPDEPHQVVAKHAAHAINHVDALYDALDYLIQNADGKVNFLVLLQAKDALDACRSEK